MTLHDVTLWLVRWSPWIWLASSVFGALMSGTLFWQSRHADGSERMTDFWKRHALWFFLIHVSYVVIGLISVTRVKNDWVTLITLVILLATPLILVYRSYDSLRVGGKRD